MMRIGESRSAYDDLLSVSHRIGLASLPSWPDTPRSTLAKAMLLVATNSFTQHLITREWELVRFLGFREAYWRRMRACRSTLEFWKYTHAFNRRRRRVNDCLERDLFYSVLIRELSREIES